MTDLERLRRQVNAQQAEIESLKAAFKIVLGTLGRQELKAREAGNAPR